MAATTGVPDNGLHTIPTPPDGASSSNSDELRNSATPVNSYPRSHGGGGGHDFNLHSYGHGHGHEDRPFPAAGFGDYGGNPLAHFWSHQSGALIGTGEAQFAPGFVREVAPTPFANAAPLGLSGFAFTTFLLSLINLNTRGAATPNIVLAPALGYGGLVQLLAGMWAMASGNTFAAWALSSYGGFWISIGIIFTPGGFEIASAYGGEDWGFYTVLGLYIMGWFIFTFIIWLATLRSTFAFSFLLFTVWVTYLTLAIGYLDNTGTRGSMAMAEPNKKWNNAGGGFGIVAAFTAWWVMLEGIQDKSNSFFTIPTFRFPWGPKDRPPGFLEADLEALERPDDMKEE